MPQGNGEREGSGWRASPPIRYRHAVPAAIRGGQERSTIPPAEPPGNVMVATNQGSRSSRGRKKAAPEAGVEAAASQTIPVAADAAARNGRSQPRPPRGKPESVTARDAAGRIRLLAETIETFDGRQRLRSLAAVVAKGSRNAQRMAFLETAIGESLDEIANAKAAAERWSTCEAATWALAWMARTKRAGGSAGGLLERIVGQARTAQAQLAMGDTQPARFVLVLARLFRDVEACRCLEDGAVTALAAEIERLVSPEGITNLTGSQAMVERVIRWTAAREIALATGRAAWSDATEKRWRAAAAAALRLVGRQGRLLAAAGRMPACFTAPLLEALATFGGRRSRTARAVARDRATVGDPDLLDRDLHDAAAGVAIIRTGWDRRSVRLMIDYRHPVPRLEIAVGDRLLVDGPWQWEAWADGRALEPEAAWTVSCWESDRKATFLELTAPLGGGRQMERQVVVLPRDRIVLLADAVTSSGAALPTELRYRGLVPLAPSLDAEPADDTREVRVSDTATRLIALPLGLPEWRTAGSGRLEAASGGLVLSQQGGGRLYAPLWLDFDAGRIGGPLTWRQLTVADTRLILPPHQAVGYRVQAGLEQWLVYRSLDTPRNRTLLGCNVSCEFLVGRVKNSGEVARTLEIQ